MNHLLGIVKALFVMKMIHMKYQALFSWKKKYFRMWSITIFSVWLE